MNIKKLLIKIHNQRMARKMENYKFLVNLCTEDRTLDLDKYLKLMKIVKKKYK